MSSDTDLPHQPDTPQHPSLIKKKSNPMWKVIFILLLIVNLIYLSPLLLVLFYGNPGFGFLGMIPYFFVFSLIDFIAVFSYIITQNPHGIAKNISYTLLIPISLVLVYSSFGIFADNVTNMKMYLIDKGIYPASLP
jgi:hypothetical protein